MQASRTLIGIALGLNALTSSATLSPYRSDGVDLVYSSFSGVTWTTDSNLLGTMENEYAASHGGDFSGLITDIINANGGTIYDSVNSYVTNRVWSLRISDFYSYPNTSELTIPTGQVTWWGARAFINYLNTISYAGINSWRLPSYSYSPFYGEFNQLFYSELSNQNPTDTFSNLHSDHWTGAYWTGSENITIPEYALTFGFDNGNSVPYLKSMQFNVWAITDGKLASVPIPSSGWLFCSSIIGIFCLRKRSTYQFATSTRLT